MKTEPVVSIIVPVYNTAKYLPKCLDSILNQTFEAIEIICINNGSNDDSANILEKYHKKDSRITIINIPKSNAGVARNAGLKIAQGTHIAFVDSDDYCDKTMLEKAISVIKKNDPDIVVFEFSTFNDKTKTIEKKHDGILGDFKTLHSYTPKEISLHIFNSFKNCPWNKIFKKTFLEQNQILFQEIPRGNDIYFTNLAVSIAKKISIIKEPLIFYRFNTGNSLQDTNNNSPISFLDAYKKLRYKLITLNIYKDFEQSLLNAVLENMLYNLRCLEPNTDAYEYLYNTIRYGAEIEFGFSKHKIKYYYDPSLYKEYLNITNAPTNEEIINKTVKEKTKQLKIQAETAISDAKKSIDEIKASKSYKLGLMLTKLPNKIFKMRKK